MSTAPTAAWTAKTTSSTPNQRNYTTFSCWDTYRAEHPLFTMIPADRVPDMVNSLIRMAEQSPAGMPVWPLQGTETGTMTGYHSASIMAEACQKNFPRHRVGARLRRHAQARLRRWTTAASASIARWATSPAT